MGVNRTESVHALVDPQRHDLLYTRTYRIVLGVVCPASQV